MPNIIVTLNAKGGVGKTTMAVNLAAQFGQKNKFNLIDADIQVSVSSWTGQNYNGRMSPLFNGEDKCTAGGVSLMLRGWVITAWLEKIMVKKHLSDLLQEEAQKLIPLENQSVIEVKAEKVTEENTLTTDKLPTLTHKQTPLKEAMSTNNNLETTIQELKQNLEESQDKGKSLQKQIVDLQSILYEKQVLIERLTKELHEAKQDALHLAESNSKLIEESKAPTPVKNNQPAIPEKESKSAIQVKEKYNPVGYKKSHQVPEYLLERQKEGDNFADNTWLYD